MSPPVLIKKYGNRRLYDTGDSRYITLEELATKIRGGTDVRVVDAQTGDDLSQATLAQIILESGTAARVLPVGLLSQMIRLGDDSLAEFFSRYVTSALELYLQAKRGVQSLAPLSPLTQIPLAATDALSRLWMASPFGQFAGGQYGGPPFGGGFGYPGAGPGPMPSAPPPAASPPSTPGAEPEPAEAAEHGRERERERDRERDRDRDDVAALRREIDELKRSLRPDARADAPSVGKPGARRRPRRGTP